jgi:hypothetical protein
MVLDWNTKLRNVKRSLALSIIRHNLYPGFWLRSQYRKELREWESRGKQLPLPSALKQGVVLEHARQFQLRILVETGTYFGAMVDACKDAFMRIYSIELQEAFFCRAKKRFARYPHVKLVHGDSAVALGNILEQISERCLFWLDAHYMGGITAKGSTECPVLRELELVGSHPVRGHVILIDDARLFLGTAGWPSIPAVAKRAAVHGWACEVRDDILRLK